MVVVWGWVRGVWGVGGRGFWGVVGGRGWGGWGGRVVRVPGGGIVGGMECICAGLLEELDDTGAVWLYIIVSAIGTGLQCLAFWIFSKL